MWIYYEQTSPLEEMNNLAVILPSNNIIKEGLT